MRWTKIEHCWECVFVNAPFTVRVWENGTAHLFFTFGINRWLIHTHAYSSVDEAKADVNNFVMNHLALYSAQVHRECLEANVMTWRKLQEQLNQIPKNQLDHPVRVLDADWDWCGTPSIVKAEKDRYSLEDNGHDTEYTEEIQCLPEVEEGYYYLSIEL